MNRGSILLEFVGSFRPQYDFNAIFLIRDFGVNTFCEIAYADVTVTLAAK